MGHTVNTFAADAARQIIAEPGHLAGVRVLGVDEHTWKHVRGMGDSGLVTVLVDLTPVIDGTGPAWLLDRVPGCSKAAFADWLNARDQALRDRIGVVTMAPRTREVPPGVRRLPDRHRRIPRHSNSGDGPVPCSAPRGGKLTLCRHRVQHDTCGHRGRAGDPLYRIRRTLLTRTGLLTAKQATRLRAGLDARAEHLAVSITYAVYQQLTDAYDHPNKRTGKTALYKALRRIRTGLPAGPPELAQLGRSLWARRAQILAYVDTGASTDPSKPSTAASNTSAESPSGSATCTTTPCGHSSTPAN